MPHALAPFPRDAGSEIVVITPDPWTETAGTITSVSEHELSLSLPDAGLRPGSPVLDDTGGAVGMLLGPGRALRTDVILERIEEARSPTVGRIRNLGISAAFFLGLAVWWVYRFRARRY